jgi:hypothetical protein
MGIAKRNLKDMLSFVVAVALGTQAAPSAPQPAINAAQSNRTVSDPNSRQVLIEDTSISETLRRKSTDDDPKAPAILSATAQDHEDWLRERARGNPTHRRPGVSVREEYEQWLKVRFKARAAQEARAVTVAAR